MYSTIFPLPIHTLTNTQKKQALLRFSETESNRLPLQEILEKLNDSGKLRVRHWSDIPCHSIKFTDISIRGITGKAINQYKMMHFQLPVDESFPPVYKQYRSTLQNPPADTECWEFSVRRIYSASGKEIDEVYTLLPDGKIIGFELQGPGVTAEVRNQEQYTPTDAIVQDTASKLLNDYYNRSFDQ